MDTGHAWKAQAYDDRMGFVPRLGESLLALLAPRAGERIVDWGCGTGDLTASIAAAGARVTGIDASPDMIEAARRKHGAAADFLVADGQAFRAEPPADAVFSNAALHWMTDAEGAAASIAASLRQGGRFVAEFGAAGNIASVANGLPAAFEDAGIRQEPRIPWYFPTVGEYASLLERHGMRVELAAAFDRPTPLQPGASGLRGWLDVFANGIFASLQPQEREAAAAALEDRLRPTLYRDGRWVMDYRRIRVAAVKA